MATAPRHKHWALLKSKATNLKCSCSEEELQRHDKSFLVHLARSNGKALYFSSEGPSLECEKKAITPRCGELFLKNRSPIAYVTKIQSVEISANAHSWLRQWHVSKFLSWQWPVVWMGGEVSQIVGGSWATFFSCVWWHIGRNVERVSLERMGSLYQLIPSAKYKRLSAPPLMFEKLNLFLALQTLWTWFNLNSETGGKRSWNFKRNGQAATLSNIALSTALHRTQLLYLYRNVDEVTFWGTV